MEIIHTYFESPLKLVFCFEKYLENEEPHLLEKYRSIPELKNGTNEIAILKKHELFFREILQNVFPETLSNNEIKAVTFPLSNYTFNYTKRFQKIIEDSGTSFKINLEDVNENEFYIFNCCFILQRFYGVQFISNLSTLFQARDKNGILRYYKISINSDFTEIIPTERAKTISEEDIDELRNNFDDVKLWKKKFPPQSWIMKGFAIISLTDTTVETSLSQLKSALLSINLRNNTPDTDIAESLKSYYNIPDINISFIPYDSRKKRLDEGIALENHISKFVLDYWIGTDEDEQNSALQHLIYNPKPILVSDIYKLDSEAKQHQIYQTLIEKKINSLIVLPIIENGELLGILELTSQTANTMNAITLKKSEMLLPFLKNTILRFQYEIENRTEAIIQREYTSIHPSVIWRFREEANQILDAEIRNSHYNPKEIVFRNLHPFFGQIDVVGSSLKRETAIFEDMTQQLLLVKISWRKW